jgi:2,4-dienoyl-CoA reductase-like NADH-dependent reductase (Old Yellow Enzyme family)
MIPGLSELAELIQEWGAVAAAQIVDIGGVVNEVGTLMPQGADELTAREINGIVEGFAAGAVRAKAAGFNAVEIHGAHGYLIAQFFSPLTNHRTDEYGGDVERRAAFPLAIVKRIREGVGKDFPLIFRLSADEHISGGMTLEQAKATAKLLEAAGINILSVTAGKRLESFEWSVQPMYMPPGCIIDLARAIKETVKIPVIGVGRINDPILANQIIAEKKADLVAMSRALIADPELPNKAFEGRYEDIRKCVACMVCHQRTLQIRRPRCMVNAVIGRRDFAIHRAEKAKKVLIAGAGPAGLEAARVLAMRGHSVILCEKTDRLGGQIPIAAMPPHKEELENIVPYLSTQLRKLGVEIKLKTPVTGKSASILKPDAVVVAIGGQPVRPQIPGIDNDNVLSAQELLRNNGDVGDKVVVIGGGFIGCEVAEFLAEKGKHVTIGSSVIGPECHTVSSQASPSAYFKTRRKVFLRLDGHRNKACERVLWPKSGSPFGTPRHGRPVGWLLAIQD